MKRCPWGSDPLMIEYHDVEWGTPVHDDHKLFEFLILDCFQAGLSWSTILHKRAAFRKAFDDFDIRTVASYNDDKVQNLLQDTGIVRNRLKIMAAITNANCVLNVQQNNGSLGSFLWNFVGGSPIINRWECFKDIPTETEESRKMSRALREEGFKFVGPTICYAFMQAVGMVNDHLVECDRHAELSK
ncbi:MAG: DNA-3-methyladenine glycosylase I [Methanomassiliicoccus sp.]|nr:MAG: DNA-3-methyladenine glycosylase I [Methanomassiliicoccus sp.]